MGEQKDFVKKIFQAVNKNSWICMATGTVVGIITHLYMLTNKLPNWDDLTTFGNHGMGIENGRWMLPKLHKMAGIWSVPALNGILAILLISVATCFILETLELRTVTSSVLFPFIMLTFPGVACSMTFMYLADIFGMGLLFGCVGTWLIRKYKYGWLPGVVLLILCIATYQSYICFVAGIMVFALVLDLFRKKDVKEVVKKGFVSLGSLMLSMGTYVILTKYVIGGLVDYKGIDKMGQIDLLKLPLEIARAYKRILEFFVIKPWGYLSKTGKNMNLLVVAIIVAGFFFLIWRLKVYKEKDRTALLCVLIVLFPLALASSYIIAPEANPTLLLLHQYVLMYLVPLGFWEIFIHTETSENRKGGYVEQVIGIGVLMVLFLVGYDNYVLTNNAYFRMDIAFTRVHSFYERLYERVEETEGYEYGDQIAILGDWWPKKNILSTYEIDFDRYVSMEGVAMENGLFTSAVRSYFLKIYLGIEFDEPLSLERMMELIETPQYQEMPCYPKEGCVQNIEGVWAIKVAHVSEEDL